MIPKTRHSKAGIRGNVRLTLVAPDGTRTPLGTFCNTANQALIGRICNYLCTQTTSEPITSVRTNYTSGTADGLHDDPATHGSSSSPAAATTAHLTCATAGDVTAADWAALTTTGHFKVTINGTLYTVTPDFTGCTTMANVATAIQTALAALLTGTTCTYNTDHFVITTPTPAYRKGGTITVLTAGATVDISGTSWMNGCTGHGVATQGVDSVGALADWTSTWVNNTGATETVEQLDIGIGTGSSFVAYCTLSGLSVSVTNGTSLEADWSIYFGADPNDEWIQDKLLTGLRDCFVTACSTAAKSNMTGTYMATFTGAGGATGGSVDLKWEGGGGLTDDFVTLVSSEINSGTAGTLATLTAWIADDPEQFHAGLLKTGLGVAWAAGETKSATITVTWSSVY